MEKKVRRVTLLIDGTGNSGWIGGLYYRRNILFSLLSNTSLAEKISVTVITERVHEKIFAPFKGQIAIKFISYRNDRERKIKLILWAKVLKAKYVFPSIGKWGKLTGSTQINWIPDFQHNRMPEFFSEQEFTARSADFRRIADSKFPLILSSQDSLSDFRKFYSQNKENVFVVPFVSYIAPELENITEGIEQSILNKFDLSKKQYVAVMNQFWQHKNHRVVFEAMKLYFANHPQSDVSFVFTGKMEDYRNPEYIQSLKNILKEPEIKQHTVLLGFIDRAEQLVIMKNAQYIIQPSLFEGWGTVVEDAKVLDKTILLSDIPVHREQKNEKCVLFDPYDAKALATLIAEESKREHQDDMHRGLAGMKKRAISYSIGFDNLLTDAEKRDYE